MDIQTKRGKGDFYDYSKNKNKPLHFKDNCLEDPEKKKKIKYLNNKSAKTKSRFSSFKESKIDSNKLKKYIYNKYEIIVSDLSAIIFSVISKIYAGELIEEARILMKKKNYKGKIKPEILELAYQKLYVKGVFSEFNDFTNIEF